MAGALVRRLGGTSLHVAVAVGLVSLCAACGSAAALSSFPRSLYPPPTRHPRWGLAEECASTDGVDEPGAHAAAQAIGTVEHLTGDARHDRRYSDPAFWPMLNEDTKPAVGPGEAILASPARTSPYAELVRNNCGPRLVQLSVRVLVGNEHAAPALTREYWVIKRGGRWLVWFTYP
jgi:hypothetical protein